MTIKIQGMNFTSSVNTSSKFIEGNRRMSLFHQQRQNCFLKSLVTFTYK